MVNILHSGIVALKTKFFANVFGISACGMYNEMRKVKVISEAPKLQHQ